MKDNVQSTHSVKTILVFKTSVTSLDDIVVLKPVLDNLMQENLSEAGIPTPGGNEKWNFDLEDCDHILRVETQLLKAMEIITLLENAGYLCVELEDDLILQSSIHFPVLSMN